MTTTQVGVFDSDGNFRRLPTLQDIEELAAHNVTVRVACGMKAHEGLSWEQALCVMVVALAKQNKELIDAAVDLAMRTPPSIVRKDGKT